VLRDVLGVSESGDGKGEVVIWVLGFCSVSDRGEVVDDEWLPYRGHMYGR
jgi:hypothetical protein